MPGADDIISDEERDLQRRRLAHAGAVSGVAGDVEKDEELSRRAKMLQLMETLTQGRRQDLHGYVDVLAATAHATAKWNGFWDNWPELVTMESPLGLFYMRLYLATKIALIHSEASETLQELRQEEDLATAMERMAYEVADTIVRCLDIGFVCKPEQFGDLLLRVMERNTTRPRKHGRAF